MESRLPINDKDCEDIVIGSMITDRDTYNEVRDILTKDCFYDYFNKAVFEAVTKISENGNVPDFITVKAELDARHITSDITQYLNLTSKYTINARQHAIRLKELAARRRMMTTQMTMILCRVRWRDLSSAIAIHGIYCMMIEMPMMWICLKKKNCIKDYVLLNIKTIHMNNVTLGRE